MSIVISIAALCVALGVGAAQVFTAWAIPSIMTGSTNGVAMSGTCLEWARFVEDEQASDRWGDLSDAEIDARIDRLGEVAYSRISVMTNESLSFDEEPLVDAPLMSIGVVCGSAGEYRKARSSREPLVLPLPDR
ncbi:hypothetical protein [Demequina phytophila]|uniref:hypothetical protein n=1 Tax=Demequina phytophila TaxID=1638981 RepID=UPI0012DFE9A2|nr:hypothetical protein [Demequina phytophila]